jgi:hypothetical protein
MLELRGSKLNYVYIRDESYLKNIGKITCKNKPMGWFLLRRIDAGFHIYLQEAFPSMNHHLKHK